MTTGIKRRHEPAQPVGRLGPRTRRRDSRALHRSWCADRTSRLAPPFGPAILPQAWRQSSAELSLRAGLRIGRAGGGARANVKRHLNTLFVTTEGAYLAKD